MLSKIVQESVEKLNKDIMYYQTPNIAYGEEIVVRRDVKHLLISSQISLLEAVREMISKEFQTGIYQQEPALVHINDKLAEKIEEIKKLIIK